MTPAEHQHLMALFDEVCDLPPDARVTRLTALRAEDAGMARELEGLLAADATPAPGLESTLAAAAVADLAGEVLAVPLPARLGEYRILSMLGEGGMGVVYEAVQDFPRRKVAIKTIRDSVATPVLRKRFEYEAHALARLSHPGIARIYQAVAGADQLFFAMELVEGATLTEYAKRHQLGLAEQLELWARVCDAVHHAHLKGVIHCDLKPANILVGEDGQPKVLDFGIARIVDPDADASIAAMSTMGFSPGTPAYMSPEQMRLRPGELDARTDVFSLGVVGFELLAGRRPHEPNKDSISELMLTVVENDSPPLSRFRPDLAGDVETVVGHALTREPERRYQSAGALADDIRRVLRHEPISARVPTLGYQLAMLARRNRGVFLALAALFLSLCAGVVVTGVLLVAADRARADLALRNDALIVAEARAELAADPTQAVARLAALRPQSKEWPAALAVAEEAESLGVSKAVLAAHSAEVHWVELDPSGRFLASAGYDQRVRITDLARRTSRVVEGVGEEPAAVRFSPDGTELALAGLGGLYLIARDAGPARRIGEGAMMVAWDPRGDGFASAGVDGTVRVWSAAGQPIGELAGHEGQVTDVAWSPDGGTLASGGRDGTVRRWDPARGTGEIIGKHDGPVVQVLFGPDTDTGPMLASIGRDGRVMWWGIDRFEGDVAGPNVLEEASQEQKALAVSPTGTWAWAGRDGALRVWRLHGQVRSVHAHDGVVRTVAFGPNGVLATAGDDRVVRLWDEETLESTELIGHAARIHHIAFSGDGHTLVSGSNDGYVRVWPVIAPGAASARTAAFSPASGELAFAGDDGVVQLRGPDDGTGRRLGHHGDEVYQLRFGPPPLLVSAGRDRSVHVWSLDTGAERTLPCAARATRVDISRDHRVAAATGVASVPLWDLDQGTETALVGHDGRVIDVRFSPDGKSLATVGDDRTLRLWDVASGTGRVLTTFGDRASSVAFTPDGRHVLAAGMDGTVRMWNADDQSVAVWTGHVGPVDALAVSPDGEWVASGGTDHTIRVWPIAGGAPRVLAGHTGSVTALVFLRPGHLASGGSDHTVRLWDTATGAGRVLARTRGPILSLSGSADGARLAVVSDPDGMRVVATASAVGADLVLGYLRDLTSARIDEDGVLASGF